METPVCGKDQAMVVTRARGVRIKIKEGARGTDIRVHREVTLPKRTLELRGSVSLENYDRPTNQQTNFRVHWEVTLPTWVGSGSGLLQEVGSGSGQYRT